MREREREGKERDFYTKIQKRTLAFSIEAQVVRFFYLRTRTPDFGGQALQGCAVNHTWIRLGKDKGLYLSQCVHVWARGAAAAHHPQ